MTPDDKLKALFATDRPRAPDYLFQAAVAERVARRRAWATVAAAAPWGVASATGLWAIAPVLPEVFAPLNSVAASVGGVLGICALALMGGRWLARQGPGLRG